MEPRSTTSGRPLRAVDLACRDPLVDRLRAHVEQPGDLADGQAGREQAGGPLIVDPGLVGNGHLPGTLLGTSAVVNRRLKCGCNVPTITPVDTMSARIQVRLDELMPGAKPGRKATWLAAQVGSDARTVDRWLDGTTKPRIDQAIPIARALGVPVFWLLNDDPIASDAPAGGAPSRQPADPKPKPPNGTKERRQGTPGRRRED